MRNRSAKRPASSRDADIGAAQADESASSPAGERGAAAASGATRGRILAAAERLFAEEGFGDVSMPAIAKASGITAGAIYKHFDSKADLFFEVVRRAVQAAPSLAAAGEGSAATRLTRIVAAYTTRELKRVRQLAIEIHSASLKHPEVRRMLAHSLDVNIAQIRLGVSAAQQAGEIDPTLDSQFAASALMAFIMGLMHMETLLPELVGDAQWRDFVGGRVAALLGGR